MNSKEYEDTIKALCDTYVKSVVEGHANFSQGLIMAIQEADDSITDEQVREITNRECAIMFDELQAAGLMPIVDTGEIDE